LFPLGFDAVLHDDPVTDAGRGRKLLKALGGETD
jgi:hypothetical protein